MRVRAILIRLQEGLIHQTTHRVAEIQIILLQHGVVVLLIVQNVPLVDLQGDVADAHKVSEDILQLVHLDLRVLLILRRVQEGVRVRQWASIDGYRDTPLQTQLQLLDVDRRQHDFLQVHNSVL